MLTHFYLTYASALLEVDLLAASTRVPWITGTVTIIDYSPYSTRTYTAMGLDGRNDAGTSGSISLVTPRLLNSFQAFGGSVATSLNRTGSVTTLTLSFLPEPGRIALLGGGLLGLLALSRRRHEPRLLN